MRRNLRSFFAAALVCLASAGCSGAITFDSPSPLGSGVSGKVWQAPYFVDAPLFAPIAYAQSKSAGGLVWDYQLATYGNNALLAGTWYDASSSSTFRGYARLYQDGQGWSQGLSQIASDGSNPFRAASLGAGPGGLFAANFFNTDGTLESGSAYYNGSNWQQALNNTNPGGSGSFLNEAPVTNSTVATAIDSLGRGYVFFANAAGLWETQWSMAASSGIGATAITASAGGTLASTTTVTATFDGVSQVCALYETSANSLQSSCQDVACAGPYTFGSPVSIDTGTVEGHDAATDSDGNIMTVYYKQSSGNTYHVYASLGTLSGTCSGTNKEKWSTPVQLDIQEADALNENYTAPYPALWTKGARPGVAYVGSGRFLAVWVGVDSTDKKTQLYSSLYDPANGGWPTSPTAVQPIGSTQDYYWNTPHPQALSVFGNGNGNAGFAVNSIYTTDNVQGTSNPTYFPGTTTAFVSYYPETGQARTLLAGRWQQDDGWVGLPAVWPPTTTPTSLCLNLLSGTPQPTQAAAIGVDGANPSGGGVDCTHAPAGVILPSGDTIVVFQAIDNYSQVDGASVVPGNRRAAVLEFR